ncbi:MAG: PD-(D/E)XK nuclease family protein [Betaproteobacteria bacterium]|nr:PD-(D/E)XK nuclease family protein [Betaproteobacteria bacterium]
MLLLPFAALLAPARAALAACGGWQPRVETPLTLTASLGPPPVAEPGACQGDAVHDRMAAVALLRRQSWGAAWAQRDAVAFSRAAAMVADAAQTLRETVCARPPALRKALWAQARAALPSAAGPAATEAALLHVALEWAAASAPPATDRLFDLRPSAWIALQIGGPDAVAEALLDHAGTPSLRLQADRPADDPWGPVAVGVDIERLLCADFEAEAQAAAAAVVSALNAGRTPVALVALDRECVRRVRALLDRAAVPLVDETGWRLSTTRAAASVVALLRAALPEAGPDAWLEWLKTWPPMPPRTLDALEALWRRRRGRHDTVAAERLWDEAQIQLQPLTKAGPRSLTAWHDLLQGQLARDGSFERLAAEADGRQLLAVMGWQGEAPWRAAAAQVQADLPAFISWVETTLEIAPYLPLPAAAAPVVLTPLARAFGRPFAQLVVPGADDLHLGAVASPPTLITAPLAAELGLEDSATRRHRQRLALAHLLRAGPVTLLRRQRDADEPRADSPDVEWLLQVRARAGAPACGLRLWRAPTCERACAVSARPLPSAATALPTELSATQLESLRQCPYRFYARAVLRLDEPDELDAALAKRDYGNWLHAVLHRFHAERAAASGDGVDDATRLQAAADAVTLEMALDAGELLPFRASFEHFVPSYLRWLAPREGQGWHWQSGETDHRLANALLPGLQLRGRIDRLDHGPEGRRQLLDYKTGSAQALVAKVKQPLEETQLAFYAALLGGGEKLAAAYLALDDADAPSEIVHPDVHASAETLLQHLGSEWQRLQAGAPMPALGEGRVCETCEARGLCRRDHWGAP